MGSEHATDYEYVWVPNMPEFKYNEIEVWLLLEQAPWIFEIELFLICYSF